VVLGHRGAAGTAPENTLPAFREALAKGAEVIESDLRGTRDGVPVLIHDAEVDRTTDGVGEVRSMSFDELQRLDAGYRFSLDDGKTHPLRGRGVRVPSLEQALAACPAARFNLELKASDLVDATLAVIRSAGREPMTLLTAGDDAVMVEIRRAVKRTGASVALGASSGEVMAFVGSLSGGVPVPGGVHALQVPAEFAGTRVVTPEFVEHAHAHDIEVHVWTVNESGEMSRWLDLGVDGLVTDYPGRLVELIARRRESSGR
jgi:glycerophosphoryl diester phosphodiesterase